MRNYNILWCIWLLWALFIMLWLTELSFSRINLNQVLVTGSFCALLLTLLFMYKKIRIKKMLSFNKQKKTIDESTSQQQGAELISREGANTLDASQGVKTKKDTYVSNGALFTGVVEGDGNIIIEGKIEGNIICEHMVRIEHSGHVKGEIRAQQIMINGAVEGCCYSASLSIQPKGSMHGDIFADEISIEKGGIFIGQSQLLQKTLPQNEPAKIAPLKTLVISPENERQDNKTSKKTESVK